MFEKMLSTVQKRTLQRYAKIVDKVNSCERELQNCNDRQLISAHQRLKKLSRERSLDELLPEAYAVVKNVCRRLCNQNTWSMIPYDVQILGAIAMHNSSIAEMQTGEGKTLTAAMPLYLHSLTGNPVHLVTVNDYLAERDCQWIGEIFRWLGLDVQSLTSTTPIEKRPSVYRADIVYATAAELGFDYLRDHSTVENADQRCQRGRGFAIIDEIDSILIDEARTPLIISGPSDSSETGVYTEIAPSAAHLVQLQRELTNQLAKEGAEQLRKENISEKGLRTFWIVSRGDPRHPLLKEMKEIAQVRTALETLDTQLSSDQRKEERTKALSELYLIIDERNNQYELTDKGISIWSTQGGVAEDFLMLDLGAEDEAIEQKFLTDLERTSKRTALYEEDRRRKARSHALHQLLQAHLLMERDVDYMVLDEKIVLIDEHTGRPQPSRRFADGLHQALEAKEKLPIQQELLPYATITLQNYFRLYEKLAGMTGTAMTDAREFRQIYSLDVLPIPTYRPCQRIDHNDLVFLNEKEKFTALLKQVRELHTAGSPVLVGTDSVDTSEKLSKLFSQEDLNHTVLNARQHAHEAEVIAHAGEKGAITIATNMAGRGTDIKLGKGVAGGLHVLGTSRHHARRIDRQLRGRSGRLGDPGQSQFYLSFEDSLLRLFTPPHLAKLIQRFDRGKPLSSSLLDRSIEIAQQRLEQRSYTLRKRTLEYDDVLNEQRREIYAFRGRVLESGNPSKLVDKLLHKWIDTHRSNTYELLEACQRKRKEQEEIVRQGQKIVGDGGKTPAQLIEEMIRTIALHCIDGLWREYLLRIEQLRTDIRMRSISHQDPLLTFKQEAYSLFCELVDEIGQTLSQACLNCSIVVPDIKGLPQEV